ncbi:substrate-binding periplasmic protein [Bowmanella denitrificans]|uniref:substrate-binding periplasmic protein n=1 Tax=Bowmanella denitrificans TaxID=366582 RepID=UPI00155859E5|nr:transporter substrate-binding domain-containing protein [Bowmanella denitrificans]
MLRMIGFLLWAMSQPGLAVPEPPIRVLTEILPPLQLQGENGRQQGLHVDVVKEALKRAGIDAGIEFHPWARAYQVAQDQPNILIFSMVRSTQREPLFIWVSKFRDIQYHFYSLNARKLDDIQDWRQARLLTVAAPRESYELQLLESLDFDATRLAPTVTLIQSWRLLLKGRVDAVFATELSAAAILSELGVAAQTVHKHTQVSHSPGLYLAASRGTDEQVIARLRHAMQDISNDGTYQTIMAKYSRPE